MLSSGSLDPDHAQTLEKTPQNGMCSIKATSTGIHSAEMLI